MPILHYRKDLRLAGVFHQPFAQYSEEYVAAKYRHRDPDERAYMLDKLTAPGSGSRGHPQYEFMGVTRYWVYSEEKMLRLLAEGRIVQSKPGTVPRYKRYLDEVQGIALGDAWDDISAINSMAKERLGYPTQKPLALLERILQASSNPGDVVLDPFCGCGTAVHAAQKLGRAWIGIDITHLAISLIEKRLRDAFPGIAFETHGAPADLAGAADLAARNKYEFQWWACSLVNAQPFGGKKKGADTGIDGLIYFQDDLRSAGKKILVSVKGGEHVGRAMIADLKNSVEREGASLGLFVTLTPPTQPMITEAASAGFYTSPHQGKFPKIQILTIAGLLAGHERPAYPDLSMGAATFKKATVERGDSGQSALFP